MEADYQLKLLYCLGFSYKTADGRRCINKQHGTSFNNDKLQRGRLWFMLEELRARWLELIKFHNIRSTVSAIMMI